MSDRVETTLDSYTCKGMEDALAKALEDAALLGSGFVMISNGDDGLTAEYLNFDAVRIDVEKLETRQP